MLMVQYLALISSIYDHITNASHVISALITYLRFSDIVSVIIFNTLAYSLYFEK